MVFQFFEEEEVIGSRGYILIDDELKAVMSLSFADLVKAKTDGVKIPNKLSKRANIITKLSYNAYEKYLEAKQKVERRKEHVIEL